MKPTEELIKLGKTTKALRIKQGLTQGNLATSTGLDLETVGDLENGLYNPGLYELKLLADCFDISLAEYFKDFD
jgi:transcriptional regulator with XRE-family HTH domain